MLWVETTLLIGTLFIMGIGIIGIISPFLPDIVFIWLGVLLYGIMTKFRIINQQFIFIVSLIVFLGFLIDYLASLWEKRAIHSNLWGLGGAVMGGVIGSVFNLVWGLILGAMVGAVVGMILSGEESIFTFEAKKYRIICFWGITILKTTIGVTIIAFFVHRLLTI